MAERTCSIDDCGKRVTARSWCSMHYYRWRTTGNPHRTASGRMNREPGGVCAVDGCEQPLRKREWCASHYAQWKRTGEVRPFEYKWGSGGYTSTHKWLRRRLGDAADQACVDCGGPAREWSYVGGGVDERVDERGLAYSRDVSRYRPRCVTCHRRFDDWYEKVAERHNG
jgi:hypothetical protein